MFFNARGKNWDRPGHEASTSTVLCGLGYFPQTLIYACIMPKLIHVMQLAI